jgi:hypothetical protein
VGILTNGINWVFVRFHEDTNEFVRSAFLVVPLSTATTPQQLEQAALEVVSRLVAMLQSQKDAVDSMHAAKRPTPA